MYFNQTILIPHIQLIQISYFAQLYVGKLLGC